MRFVSTVGSHNSILTSLCTRAVRMWYVAIYILKGLCVVTAYANVFPSRRDRAQTSFLCRFCFCSQSFATVLAYRIGIVGHCYASVSIDNACLTRFDQPVLVGLKLVSAPHIISL